MGNDVTTIHRKLNIRLLNKYINIIKGDTTAVFVIRNYDSDSLVNVLDQYFDKYKDSVIDYNMFVNFMTKLDMMILRDGEFLMYNFIKAKVVEVYSVNEIKVEYTYRR